MFIQQQYQDILQAEFDKRKNRSPNYSLRAFARSLEIDPSRLSRILSFKEGLSQAYAEKIANKIGLDEKSSERFCFMVAAQHAKSIDERKLAQRRLDRSVQEYKRTELEFDTFKAISEWTYFAVMELMDVVDFKSDHNWIAKKLNLDREEVDEVIQRLLKLKLVKLNESGGYEQTYRELSTPENLEDKAFKVFHSQYLTKAREAVLYKNYRQRHASSLTFTLHQDDIPVIEEMIDKFRNELGQFIKEKNTQRQGEEVYHLNFVFFPLSQKIEETPYES